MSFPTAGTTPRLYIREYEIELGGLPWKNVDVWLRNSYAFTHVDRIKIYQALRSLGIDTQLIIYPGQSHQADIPARPHAALRRLAREVLDAVSAQDGEQGGLSDAAA